MTGDGGSGNMGPMPERRALAPSLLLLLAGFLVPIPAAAATTTNLDQRYEIRATLDVAAARLDAIETLTVTNRSSATLDHLNLSVVPQALGYLSMPERIRVNGAEVDATWTTGINLRVPLPDVAAGRTARVHIPFTLQVGRSPDAFSARTSAENGVLSFGQWFPIVSTEHDVYGLGDPQISFTADVIRLELTTTTPLGRNAVACPGLREAPGASGTTWACESHDVRDFSFVVNPRFRLTERTVADTDLRVYTETVAGDVTADLATQALTTLSEAFGDYPWPDLVLAEVGAGGGFSMEYPRMIHLTRGKVADPYVVYHEVAHQWFYAQLGNDQQHEPWLDEAFADFSARWLLGIGPNACGLRPVDSEVFAWPADPTTGGDWTSCDGYFESVFYRGTEFLNAVRAAMGDDAFFAAVRDWVTDHRHGFVTGEHLLRHLQHSTDADLGPIFAIYLEHPPARIRGAPPGAYTE
jgi:peptidase M1-like protein